MEFDPRLEDLNKQESEDNVPLLVAVGIMLCLGLAGNAVAFIFYTFIEKRTVTSFLIAVLAFNDMMTNLVFFDEMYVHVEQFKFTSVAGCKIVYVINNWVMVNSVSLMLLIAIERHRKICHPFSWQISKFRAKVIVVVVTLVTLVFCCREGIFADIVPEHILMNDNSTVIGYVCVHSDDDNLKTIIKGSNISTMVVYISLFVGTIVCYSLIICKIYKMKAGFSTFGDEANSEKRENTSNVGKQEFQGIPTNQEQCTYNVKAEHKDTGQDNFKDNTRAVGDQQISIRGQTSNDAELGIQKDSHQSNKAFQIDKQEVPHSRKDQTSNFNNTSVKQENKALTEPPRKYPQDKLTTVERKLTIMVIVIAISSILSFIPYFFVILLMSSHHSTEENLSNMKKKAVRESYKLNGVINPFIMGIFSSTFREFVANLMCRCFRKKKN